MNNFRLFGHLDTFAVTARMHRYVAAFQQDRFLVVENQEALKPHDEWKSLHGLIARARKLLGGGEVLRDAVLLRSPASLVSPWDRPTDEGVNTFIVPLVTNPGMVWYIGPESMHLPVGSLWWGRREVLGCRANWGFTPAYHLVFSLLNAPAPEDPGAGA